MPVRSDRLLWIVIAALGLTVTFTVRVSDGEVSSGSTQQIVVTITGTNDAIVVRSEQLSGAVCHPQKGAQAPARTRVDVHRRAAAGDGG